MPDKDIVRITRITAILIRLQTKKIVTATELAQKFGVSVRTIYRDIRTLEQAGVPVYTEEGKGYSILEGFKLPPVMFTESEANALITAEKVMAASKDASLVKEFSEAIQKIKAVLSWTGKEKAELLSQRVVVSKTLSANTTSRHLAAVQTALTNRRLIKLEYRSSGNETTTRFVEPFALYNSAEEDWTLAAFCRLRGDFRSFRLDRILVLEVTEQLFPPHEITLEQYVKKYVNPNRNP